MSMLKFVNNILRIFGVVLVKVVNSETKEVLSYYFDKASRHPIKEVTREDLLAMIQNIEFLSRENAIEMEKRGLGGFHRDKWMWETDSLKQLSDKRLAKLLEELTR